MRNGKACGSVGRGAYSRLRSSVNKGKNQVQLKLMIT